MFLSSLAGRTCLFASFPSTSYWTTFIESLRDRSSPENPKLLVDAHRQPADRRMTDVPLPRLGRTHAIQIHSRFFGLTRFGYTLVSAVAERPPYFFRLSGFNSPCISGSFIFFLVTA